MTGAISIAPVQEVNLEAKKIGTSCMIKMGPFTFQEELAVGLDSIQDTIGTKPRHV